MEITEFVAAEARKRWGDGIYSTRNAVEGLEIPTGITDIRTNGFANVGDDGDAFYRRKSIIEADAYGDFTSNAGTVRWAVVGIEFCLKQFGAVTTATVALWNAVSIDWYALGTANIPFFWTRARIHHNRIMGALAASEANDTSVGSLNGVYLNYPFSVEVMDNYIFGAWDGSYNTNGIDAFLSYAGIYVPDQSQRTLAYLRMEKCPDRRPPDRLRQRQGRSGLSLSKLDKGIS